MKTCHNCGRDLNLAALKNAKQRRAAHVCAQCVRESMTPEELQRRLHPGIEDGAENERVVEAEREIGELLDGPP